MAIREVCSADQKVFVGLIDAIVNEFADDNLVYSEEDCFPGFPPFVFAPMKATGPGKKNNANDPTDKSPLVALLIMNIICAMNYEDMEYGENMELGPFVQHVSSLYPKACHVLACALLGGVDDDVSNLGDHRFFAVKPSLSLTIARFCRTFVTSSKSENL